ncbi:MAG: hypothetical protein ACKVS9_00290 [Phycisphaerae bacterium]
MTRSERHIHRIAWLLIAPFGLAIMLVGWRAAAARDALPHAPQSQNNPPAKEARP